MACKDATERDMAHKGATSELILARKGAKIIINNIIIKFNFWELVLIILLIALTSLFDIIFYLELPFYLQNGL